MARRDRGQFQFSFVEIGVLAASFLVTSVLVFLLGFYVGRQLAFEHRPLDERVARIPVTAAPEKGGGGKGKPVASDGTATEEPPLSKGPGRPGPNTQPRGTAGAAEDTVGSGAANPALQAPADTGAQVHAGSSAVPYTVQVLATRNRREAEALVGELKQKGVGAFITRVEEEDGKWYRVRVGRYDDVHSARVMAERCRNKLGLAQAYVTPYRTNAQ